MSKKNLFSNQEHQTPNNAENAPQTFGSIWQDLNLEPENDLALQLSALVLIGRIISSRPLNKHALHATIKSAWSFAPAITIEDLDVNTFLFTFATEQERIRVLEQRPWNIKGFHMLIRDWPPGLSLNEINLKRSVFWVQIHGLPLEFMTIQNAGKIATKLGKFIQVEKTTSPRIFFRRFMRVQVEINVENPLLEGFPLIRTRRPSTWVSFKYERLSDFCYCCGRLGHIQQACPILQTQTAVSNFGPWMRAESQNARRNVQAEEYNPAEQRDSDTLYVDNHLDVNETRQFFPPRSSKGKEKMLQTETESMKTFSNAWMMIPTYNQRQCTAVDFSNGQEEGTVAGTVAGSRNYMSVGLGDIFTETRVHQAAQGTTLSESITEGNTELLIQSKSGLKFPNAKEITTVHIAQEDPMAQQAPPSLISSPSSLIHINSKNSVAPSEQSKPKEMNLFHQILAQFENLKSPTDSSLTSHSLSLLVSPSGRSVFAIKPKPNSNNPNDDSQPHNRTLPSAIDLQNISVNQALDINTLHLGSSVEQSVKTGFTQEGSGESTFLSEINTKRTFGEEEKSLGSIPLISIPPSLLSFHSGKDPPVSCI